MLRTQRIETGGVGVEVLDARSVDAQGRRAWAELAERAAEPNPFLSPEFVTAWVRGRSSAVPLGVVRDDGRWLACLPLPRSGRWRRLPLPCLGAWLPDYAYLATPLVDGASVEAGVDGLLALVARERLAAALVLDPVDVTGPVGGALLARARAAGLAPIVHAEFERAALRRRPDATYLDEAISGAGRKKLRKARRTLEAELGAPLEVVDRAGDPEGVETFLELERAGWKGEAGTALASKAADAGAFRIACAGMAAAGRLQLLSLQAGGRTAAMQCNLLALPDLYAFKVAFDPALARFSPGAVLEVEAIDSFHADPRLTRADSCAAPDSPLVNRLWPDRRPLQTLLVPTGASRARLVASAVRAEAGARRARGRLRPPKTAAA